ncbi:MAG: carbon-nitrogen hydrolase family protein [Planctomycetes bacterium]|nr:carbon-nitrogen hydrolase family protein [Planctomycetota bacterium]
MSQPRIASVVQTGSILLDTPQTMEKLTDLAADARRAGAQLAVFPEAFVGGYPKGWRFGVSLGRRSAEGREAFRQYADSAVTVPGPEMETIARVARDCCLDLAVGVIERDATTLYCTVVFCNAAGQYLGKHRKVMPTALERVIWGAGDGSTLSVIETRLGRTGAVICWENYMPQLRMAMYDQGIEIYCAPTVDDRETWIPTMRHIAVEGRCFVLSACQFLPALNEADSPNEPPVPLIRGGSCIVSPFGELLAGPVYGTEQILTAEIDLADITRGRFDLDVTGHYARPDLFQLYVNRQEQRAVRDCVADQSWPPGGQDPSNSG